MTIVWSILIGIAAGISGGLFGIGGGIVIVPALIMLLGFTQKGAQGTSLMALILPVSALAVWSYHQKGHVDFRVGLLIALGFVLGGYLGSKIALDLDPVTMRRSFAVFLIIVAIYMFFRKEPAPTPTSSGAERSAPSRP